MFYPNKCEVQETALFVYINASVKQNMGEKSKIFFQILQNVGEVLRLICSKIISNCVSLRKAVDSSDEVYFL